MRWHTVTLAQPAPEDLSLPDTLTILLIILLSGLIQGITGFGFGLFAMGALVLIMPVRDATVIVAILSLGSAALNLSSVWKQIPWRDSWPVVLPAIPATIAGVLMLQIVPTQVLKAGVALMILAGCAVTFWHPARPLVSRPNPAAYLTGIVGGIFGGALNMGGPPIVLYTLLRGWDKTEAKCIMSSFFLVTGVLRVGTHAVTGAATWPLVQTALLLLIPALAATFVGVHVFRRLSTRSFRYAAAGLLVALAVRVLAG
ncbi:MAG: sulfite exporter TauE/SafE family protein [Anaerolineae bacterium]